MQDRSKVHLCGEKSRDATVKAALDAGTDAELNRKATEAAVMLAILVLEMVTVDPLLSPPDGLLLY